MNNILLLCIIALMASCIKEKCKDVVCANGGVCVEDVCACPTGYEGEYCENTWGQKFEGTWQAYDEFVRDTTGARQEYDIQITGATDSLIVTGLADTLGSLVAKKTGRYVFTFNGGYYVGNINDSVKFVGGKGTLQPETGKVTGLFSLLKKDITTTHRFSWTK
jgi:hypothetical protein